MTNWQIGDYAMCITRSPIEHRTQIGRLCRHQGTAAPPVGSVRQVVRIAPAMDGLGNRMSCGCLSLHFEQGAGVAVRFVKVTPDEQNKATEAEHKIKEPAQ